MSGVLVPLGALSVWTRREGGGLWCRYHRANVDSGRCGCGGISWWAALDINPHADGSLVQFRRLVDAYRHTGGDDSP